MYGEEALKLVPDLDAKTQQVAHLQDQVVQLQGEREVLDEQMKRVAEQALKDVEQLNASNARIQELENALKVKDVEMESLRASSEKAVSDARASAVAEYIAGPGAKALNDLRVEMDGRVRDMYNETLAQTLFIIQNDLKYEGITRELFPRKIMHKEFLRTLIGDAVDTYNFDTSEEVSEGDEEEEGPGEEPEVNTGDAIVQPVVDAVPEVDVNVGSEVAVDADTGRPLDPLNV